MTIQAYTAEQKETQESLGMVIWDLFKDVNGIRPRWMDFSSMTIEELEGMISRLQEELVEVETREAEMDAQAIKEFEASVSNVMEICGCDRYRAMEYLMDAEDVQRDYQDVEHFFYNQDVGVRQAMSLTREYFQCSPKKVA